jgi:voltage-gated potassium channel
MRRTTALTNVEQWYARIAAQPFRGAWQGIAAVTLAIALVAGVLVRITDPHRYHSIWAGMWWGMQTVTTVGYGDVVPQTAAGRLTGVAVMLVGISFITVTAGAITSEFVEAARRRRQNAPEAALSSPRSAACANR